ncbi:Ppx/GppA family phosphatase, partial [Francisella tularensis subsp. holarctica]|nr:Ppx/GppA family phosphatase [Francisella tularensis subsp. holarctica]
EFVICRGNKIVIARSLDMVCVGMQKYFFANEKLDFANFHAAASKAREIIAPILYRYKRIVWSTVLGSTGTIISVTNICQKLTGNS